MKKETEWDSCQLYQVILYSKKMHGALEWQVYARQNFHFISNYMINMLVIVTKLMPMPNFWVHKCRKLQQARPK